MYLNVVPLRLIYILYNYVNRLILSIFVFETASSINCQGFLVPVSSLVLTVFSRYEEQSLHGEQELAAR